MAHDAQAGVAVEHALELERGELRAVGDAGLAGALGAVAVAVDGDQVGAVGAGEQGVEDRPVGDRLGAVLHLLALAERVGDRAGVQMVAGEGDRTLQAAVGDRLVDLQRQQAPLAVAEPADAGGQAGEVNVLARHLDPVVDRVVGREGLQDDVVDRRDVLGVARDGEPAERPEAFAEQGPDEHRHERADLQHLVQAEVVAPDAQAIAVFEG